MTEVVSVRFKNKGKVYYFDPMGIHVEQGQNVVVETAKGLEFAECAAGNHEVDDSAVRAPLRPVMRVATEEDVKREEENRIHEAEAMAVCKEKIRQHDLDMKLVDVEYNFEGSKILFFFTSEGRVDFRDLVKDLAGIFKTRIELRQIGVRDEARMVGGLGICGRPFCCAQFLDDFQPVSIKMAKVQGFSLNPAKISGACGRLMCCLKYEQDTYEDLIKHVPKVDSFVDTPDGKGTVADINLLKGTVHVKLEDQQDINFKTYEASQVTVLGGKAKRAEYLAARAEEKVPEQEIKNTDTAWMREEIQPAQEQAKNMKPEAKPESEPKIEGRAKPEIKDKTEPRPRTEQKDKAEPKPRTEQRDKAEPRPRTEQKDKAEPRPRTEQKNKAETKPGAEQRDKTESKPRTKQRETTEQRLRTEQRYRSESKPATEQKDKSESRPRSGQRNVTETKEEQPQSSETAARPKKNRQAVKKQNSSLKKQDTNRPAQQPSPQAVKSEKQAGQQKKRRRDKNDVVEESSTQPKKNSQAQNRNYSKYRRRRPSENSKKQKKDSDREES